MLPLWEFRKKTCEPTDGGKATENGVFSIRCNSRIENEEFHPFLYCSLFLLNQQALRFLTKDGVCACKQIQKIVVKSLGYVPFVNGMSIT